jgi:hypothetical protein
VRVCPRISIAHMTTSSRKSIRNMRSICPFACFPPFLRLCVYCRIFVSFRASLGGSMRVGVGRVKVEVEVEHSAGRLLDLEGV